MLNTVNRIIFLYVNSIIYTYYLILSNGISLLGYLFFIQLDESNDNSFKCFRLFNLLQYKNLTDLHFLSEYRL